MKTFTYHYQGISHTASYTHYLKEGYNRYRITIENGAIFVIARFGMDPKIWMQAIQGNEVHYPHDYIQAVGEGLHSCLTANEPGNN